MQEVKCFFRGLKNGEMLSTSLEEQINAFLRENPAYSAKAIDLVDAGLCREAYVIFDVREEKKQQGMRNPEMKHPEGKKHG